jgi:hypothetical protein
MATQKINSTRGRYSKEKKDLGSLERHQGSFINPVETGLRVRFRVSFSSNSG